MENQYPLLEQQLLLQTLEESFLRDLCHWAKKIIYNHRVFT